METNVYARRKLLAGNRIAGGAIIEQEDCTTVVEPTVNVTVDAYGNLLLEIPA